MLCPTFQKPPLPSKILCYAPVNPSCRLKVLTKKLTTALERLSITNEIATSINNENNVIILTQNVFDAIDSVRLKKNCPDDKNII